MLLELPQAAIFSGAPLIAEEQKTAACGSSYALASSGKSPVNPSAWRTNSALASGI
ncbi:hypothetical protein PS723_04841 [Pseudomonas fluorescens]|uniref:Uncharacterized protein n=1 Tax=Pseudomonas fluorescens TaxID=294 RepID=A0A5E7ES72_PSEFL|nr:hypothetical protein PS723_04841 [Pseudomonas fluorescens]